MALLPENPEKAFCSACKEAKDVACFNTHKGGKDNIASRCKSCQAAYTSKRKQAIAESAEFLSFQALGCTAKICLHCGISYIKPWNYDLLQFFSQKLCKRGCKMPKNMRSEQDAANKKRAYNYAQVHRHTELGKASKARQLQTANEKYANNEEHRKMWCERQKQYTLKSGYKQLYTQEKRESHLVWLEQNREYFNAWQKQYRKRKIHEFAWRSMLRSAHIRMNTQKRNSSIKELGYSAIQLKDHLTSLFTESMSWDNYGEWHIDHIKPVSLFAKESLPSEVNALSNLQPLWAADNMKKSNKYAEAYA